MAYDDPASLATLWRALGRRDDVERKHRALDAAPPRSAALDADDTCIDVVVARDAPLLTRRLPARTRVVAGCRQALRQHSRWQRDGAASANVQLAIEPAGLPLRARASGTASERSPGCTRLALHVAVHRAVPLVGAEAARLFANEARRSLDADQAFTLADLAAHAPA